jgi:hypothetical protein
MLDKMGFRVQRLSPTDILEISCNNLIIELLQNILLWINPINLY